MMILFCKSYNSILEFHKLFDEIAYVSGKNVLFTFQAQIPLLLRNLPKK